MSIQLEIGSIDRAHGIKGEVIVRLISNAPERLKPGSKLETSQGILVVENARAHKGRFIVGFEGIATRDLAESLQGLKLTAPPLESSSAGDLWVHELVGCELFDQNEKSHGKIVEIQANPASDLLVLASEALVPANFIASTQEGKVFVDVPEGLLE